MKPNDLKEDKPKNLIVRKDLKEIGYNKKVCGPHKHPKLQSGSDEFIVDWQIPKSELSKRQTAKH